MGGKVPGATMLERDTECLVQRDHERLTSEVERLRAELAAAERELAEVGEHLAMHEAEGECRCRPDAAPESLRSERPSLHAPLEDACTDAAATDDADDATREGGSRSGADGAPIERTPTAAPLTAPGYLVLSAYGHERRIPVTSAVLIGSDDDCDLVLPSGLGIAGEHATVCLQDGELILRALAGPGSVAVDGRPMTWASLEDGDVLDFCGFEVRVSLPGTTERPHSIAV